MVERDIGPLRRLMAGAAVRAELTVMVVLVGMTGIAILGRAFVRIVHMTRLAGSACMRPCQRETRTAVIECRVLPFARVVTGGTDRAELSVMGIVPGVTGNTFFWRSLIHAIRMTSRTLYLRMTAV